MGTNMIHGFCFQLCSGYNTSTTSDIWKYAVDSKAASAEAAQSVVQKTFFDLKWRTIVMMETIE